MSARSVANVLAVSKAFLVPFSLNGASTRMTKRTSWLFLPRLAGDLNLAMPTYLFCNDGKEHLKATDMIVKYKQSIEERSVSDYVADVHRSISWKILKSFFKYVDGIDRK